MHFPPGPFFGLWAYFSFYRDPLRYLAHTLATYGDIVHLRFGSRHDFLIGHVEGMKAVLLAGEDQMFRSINRSLKRLMGSGLLCSQGDLHRSRRRLLQPSFQQNRVETYAASVATHIKRLSQRWRDLQVFDVNEEMLRLTMSIIAQALFSVDLEGQFHEFRDDLQTILSMTNHTRIAARNKEKFHAARARLDAFIYQLIEERRSSESPPQDFLSEMLGLRNASDDSRALMDEDVRDEALTMFMAGHETTATVLAWTWILLSRNPEVQRAMHEELQRVLGGRTPTTQDLPALKYSSMVLLESMRLYPPVWLMTRRTAVDYPLDGFVLPAGSYIHVSQYVAHRDPRNFADPLRFDPLRWTGEACATRSKFSYFPFGAGSRKCIGEHVALAEALLVLASVAQQWELELLPGSGHKPLPLVTLRPGHGMMMRLRQRDPAQFQAPVPAEA